MKACVVTVYNSTNCGSFLQAYALKYTLEQLGCTTSFLRTGVKNNRKIFVTKALRNIKRRKINKIKFDYTVYKNFQRALKNFETIPFSDNEINDQDVFVLGSDEIWNASRDLIRRSPVFFGKGINKKLISYAPSVNTATAEDIKKIEHVEALLAKIDRISVRDNHSKQIISQFTNGTVSVQCDPTFLLPMDEYDKIEGSCPFNNFIMVYSAGGRFDEKDKKNIKEFSNVTGKQLISFPHKLDWCDHQVPADPFDAIAFFKKADYVITDTFHGTALSLIFNKEFIAIPRGNTKVEELLRYFELPQLMSDGTDKIKEYFKNIHYSKDDLNIRIRKERESSISYLTSALMIQGD